MTYILNASWHDLHFEREKDLFRTFSGAVGRFHFQTVMSRIDIHFFIERVKQNKMSKVTVVVTRTSRCL